MRKENIDGDNEMTEEELREDVFAQWVILTGDREKAQILLQIAQDLAIVSDISLERAIEIVREVMPDAARFA